jgi:serine protease Do
MHSSILVIALIGATALAGQVRSDPETELSQIFSGGSYLGLGLADIDTDRASALKLNEARGVEVTKVEEGSPAEKAGIKQGDVLLSYNGENILGAQQLGRLVRETPQGRKIKIQLWRDGRTQTLTVVPEARRVREFDAPARLMHLEMPDMPNMVLPEIPTPLMLWKSTALGIECEPVDSQLAEYFGVKHGVLVRSVVNGSPAQKAGVKAGDVLTSIGDRSITTPHDVTGFLRMQRQTGNSIPVVIERDHRQLTLNVAPPDYQH